ncbi:MAG: ATP-binding protein [Clostridium sp.]|nr:ATP-binding protein [Clostridium sp.]
MSDKDMVGILINILFVVVSLVLLLYIKLIYTYEQKRKNDILKRELDLYLDNIKENTILEMKKNRHDLKHKLTYMLVLSRNKEYEKLEAYIEELADLKSADGLSVAKTNHTLIDTLVNSKYVAAQSCGIRFRAKLDIPYNLPFDNADLCVILGNVLDNAIEANRKQGIEDAYINLKMKYDRGNLAIFLENTFDGIVKKDSKGKLVTRKKNRESHGIGICSIQNSLTKYHGYMGINVKDKIYKLMIIMYPPQTQR